MGDFGWCSSPQGSSTTHLKNNGEKLYCSFYRSMFHCLLITVCVDMLLIKISKLNWIFFPIIQMLQENKEAAGQRDVKQYWEMIHANSNLHTVLICHSECILFMLYTVTSCAAQPQKGVHIKWCNCIWAGVYVQMHVSYNAHVKGVNSTEGNIEFMLSRWFVLQMLMQWNVSSYFMNAKRDITSQK